MKRTVRFAALLMAVVSVLSGLASCDKHHDEPEINPDLDSELFGSWYSKIILGEDNAEVTITFNSDGTMAIVGYAHVTQLEQDIQIQASGEWTAKNGTLNIDRLKSDLPELDGKAFAIKYEIVVGQLYFQDLPLFPFDKVG